jgi:hypothetical protein
MTGRDNMIATTRNNDDRSTIAVSREAGKMEISIADDEDMLRADFRFSLSLTGFEFGIGPSYRNNFLCMCLIKQAKHN